MLEIRQMEVEDLDEVALLEKEIFSKPWSKEGFLQSLLQEHTLYLVASIDGDLVGYCGILQILEEGNITNMAVDTRFRRQKIACEMLRSLLSQAHQRGVTAVTLEVRKSNMAAIKLYEKLGFKEEGIRKDFYERPKEDAVIMWKR